jgi:hypothetical protein
MCKARPLGPKVYGMASNLFKAGPAGLEAFGVCNAFFFAEG